MDRMLYIGMSGAKETLIAHGINSNNLANVSTTGFRADMQQARSQPVFGPGLGTRVYAMTERPGIDYSEGPIETTRRELDVAIKGDGWFAVTDAQGNEAYTRAGSLNVTPQGFVVNGSGYRVLGNGGALSLPPADAVIFGVDGTVSIKPAGQAGAALAVVDRLRLVNPPLDQMEKGEDGLFRLKSGANAAFDPNVRVMSGALERSNVSVVEAMTKIVDLSRHYELQVKAMKTAEENDSATQSLLRMSS